MDGVYFMEKLMNKWMVLGGCFPPIFGSTAIVTLVGFNLELIRVSTSKFRIYLVVQIGENY